MAKRKAEHPVETEEQSHTKRVTRSSANPDYEPRIRTSPTKFTYGSKGSTRTLNVQTEHSDILPPPIVLIQTPKKRRVSPPSTTLSKALLDDREDSPTPMAKLPRTPIKSVSQNICDTLPIPSSPTKITHVQASPKRLPHVLPPHLHACLNAQKRAILAALRDPPKRTRRKDNDADEDTEESANDIAFQQLSDLLAGTVERGEGNSCLLLGPRNSGKTKMVESCIAALPDKPIVIRLSGWAQQNDRLAMREIARQLSQQTGTAYVPEDEQGTDDEENPFAGTPATSLPPPAYLPALISVLPTLARPTIVVLDAFELFAEHARQSLLYCLLDTAQSCRASQGNKGLAVVGVSSRVDTVNLLEKRVKSRFSGRILRTAGPQSFDNWVSLTSAILLTPAHQRNSDWAQMWKTAVEKFLADRAVQNNLNETFALARDIRVLSRILAAMTLELSPQAPFPSSSLLNASVISQRSRPNFPFLNSLSYPSICILIAAMHIQTSGHDNMTFEQLHECFRDHVRASSSAPVQLGGNGIGMVRCTRQVLMSAFERMISSRYFVNSAPSTTVVGSAFVKYRCVVEREDVKKAVEKMGQTNLKKWFSRAQ